MQWLFRLENPTKSFLEMQFIKMKLAFLESVCYDGPNEKLNIVR